MYHLYSYQCEEFNAHYHQRSNVETVLSMIKAKFGEKLRSRTEAAQANELLCKILAHNLCVVIQSMYELGIESNFCGEVWRNVINEETTHVVSSKLDGALQRLLYIPTLYTPRKDGRFYLSH
jgi:hypothetical protein